MNDLAMRGPLGLKGAKSGRDPAYLAAVRSLPCCICDNFGYAQTSPTQAHHPIHERYSAERTPDHEAIPLCEGHHQGDFDTTKIAIHRNRSLWLRKYGSDRNYIAQTQDKIEGDNQ